MRYVHVAWLVAIFAVALIFAAKGLTQPDERTDLLRITNARMHALYARDKATWDRYTSDRYESIYSDGTIKTKQSTDAARAPDYSDTAVWSGTPSIRIIGGTALLTGRQIETEKYSGGSLVTTFTRTEIYAKENGEWKAEAAQVTVNPKNYAKAVDAPKDLAQFTGRYRWTPRLIETLRASNGRLMSTFSKETSPLFFVGPDATMESDDLSVGTFYRNSHGHVNGYIYRRCDGQTINIPRISEKTEP